MKHPGFPPAALPLPAEAVFARPCRLELHPDGRHALVQFSVSCPAAAKLGWNGWRWTLEYWDLERAERQAIWNGDDFAEWFSLLRFTPDGKHVATLSNKGVSLWDVATGKRAWGPMAANVEVDASRVYNDGTEQSVIWRHQPESKDYLIFRDDGQHFYLTHRRVAGQAGPPSNEWLVEEYETATGRIVRTWGRSFKVPQLLAVSPDGHLAATANRDVLSLENPVTAKQALVHWRGHYTQVRGLAFSPDGTLLATCDSDGVLKLWNLPWINQEMTTLGLGWKAGD